MLISGYVRDGWIDLTQNYPSGWSPPMRDDILRVFLSRRGVACPAIGGAAGISMRKPSNMLIRFHRKSMPPGRGLPAGFCHPGLDFGELNRTDPASRRLAQMDSRSEISGMTALVPHTLVWVEIYHINPRIQHPTASCGLPLIGGPTPQKSHTPAGKSGLLF